MRSPRRSMLSVILPLLLIAGCGVTEPSDFAGEWTCLWFPLLLSSDHQSEDMYRSTGYCAFPVDREGRAAVADTIWYRTAPIEPVFQAIALDLRFAEGGAITGTGAWYLLQGRSRLVLRGSISGQIRKQVPYDSRDGVCTLRLQDDNREHLLRFELFSLY